MTDIRRYSISSRYHRQIHEILDKWRQRNCNESAKICEAIILLHQDEERGNKLPNFMNGPPEQTLDKLPKMWESLTRDDLKKLDTKDTVRLYKMMHYNLSVMKQWLDSHEDRRVLLDK